MNNNRSKKRNVDDQFRVITFDELQYRHPSLTEYIRSLKTRFYKACARPSNSQKKDIGTSTKGIRKSRSSSAIAMRSRSISNNVLRKYTRSRTVSVEDLKRLFLINSVFSSNRLRSSQVFSKKRSIKTKIKNGEEYLNKWDRDIRVLYSNENNNLLRSGSRHSPDPIPTDGEAPVCSSSTSASSDKMGLLINAWNCGRKECTPIPTQEDQGICDFRSKYCTSKKVCPFFVDKFPGADRKNKTSQRRDAKILVDRACSAVTACFCRPQRKGAGDKNNKGCACCLPNFPRKKLVGRETDNSYSQKSNKLCTCGCYTVKDPKTDRTNPNVPYFCTKCYSTMQKAAELEIHCTNTQTPNNDKRKNDVLKSDYAKTQTSDEICTLCYCPFEKPAELKTDDANTQTSNNKVTGRCRKTDHANTQPSKSTCPVCGFSMSKKDSPKINFADTQTSSHIFPKRKKAMPKSNHSTQTFMDLFACSCSKQKEHFPDTGDIYTRTSDNLPTRRHPKEIIPDRKTDHAKLLTLKHICSCRTQTKKKNKLKKYNVLEQPKLTSRNCDKLRAYFGKLRRRNIEQNICRKAAMRRLKTAHKRATASTTTTTEMTSAPSTSRSRRKAVLSAFKQCPCCVTPIFPHSPLNSAHVFSETPFQDAKAPNKNTLFSKLKSPDVTPDHKKQYILYHNSARGWLVKPLRARHSSSLGINKRQEDRSGHTDRPTNAHNEMYSYNKPVGNNDSNSSRNHHRRNCHKHSNECPCSSWARENSSSGYHVQNYVKNSPREVTANSSSEKRHKCNCCNIKNSPSRKCLSRSERKCNCCEGKVNTDLYSCRSCKHIRQPNRCPYVVYPCCYYPFPYCIKRKNKKSMTKKVHICDKPKICVKKLQRKRRSKHKRKKAKKHPVGCDWLYCSAPRCVFLEWCYGCKRCCKTLVLILTAVLWCPVVVVMFILHDLVFPCI